MLRDLAWRAYEACERRITPGLRHSQMQYEDVLSSHVRAGVRWLDLGCGRRILPEWRLEAEVRLVARAERIVGLDPDVTSLRDNSSLSHRVAGIASALPFPAGTFDLVTGNMVVEHLADPVLGFGEIARVLRPGGRLLVNTPNAHGYLARFGGRLPEQVKSLLVRVVEGRREEDRFPACYRANTPDELRAISAQAGLLTDEVRLVNSGAEFARLLPLAILELLWLRRLMRPENAAGRPCIIAFFQRPAESSPDGERQEASRDTSKSKAKPLALS